MVTIGFFDWGHVMDQCTKGNLSTTILIFFPPYKLIFFSSRGRYCAIFIFSYFKASGVGVWTCDSNLVEIGLLMSELSLI